MLSLSIGCAISASVADRCVCSTIALFHSGRWATSSMSYALARDFDAAADQRLPEDAGEPRGGIADRNLQACRRRTRSGSNQRSSGTVRRDAVRARAAATIAAGPVTVRFRNGRDHAAGSTLNVGWSSSALARVAPSPPCGSRPGSARRTARRWRSPGRPTPMPAAGAVPRPRRRRQSRARRCDGGRAP